MPDRCLASSIPSRFLWLHFVGALFAFHGLTISVCGEIVLIKELEFNVEGLLPSSQSDIVFYSTGLPETTVYSATSGILQQRTINGVGDSSGGNHSYLWPDVSSTGGNLNSDWGTIVEFNLRVNEALGSGGIYAAAYDGAGEYGVYFAENNRINVVQSTGITSYNLGDFGLNYNQFLLYRLESLPNSDQVSLHVGGTHVSTFTASTSGGNSQLNGFGFGDGYTDPGIAGIADWDFLRVYQVTSVPEPTGLAMFCTGSIFCLLRRSPRTPSFVITKKPSC